MAGGETFTNALIGALVTIVATPVVPFAPLLGGAVSGYLQGGDSRDGVTVGVIAGVLALIPLLLILIVLGNLFLFLFALTGEGLLVLLSGLGLVAVVFLILSGLIYVVFLSALGGWVGNYLKTEAKL